MFLPRSIIMLILMSLLFFISGCTQSASNNQAVKIDDTPEEVLREFFLVNLNPDATTMRKLVLDHKNVDILWVQGSYPKEVAKLLEKQYREMEIVRVNDAKLDNANQVLLQSSAFPMPMRVVKVNGAWKVDASPIIEFRINAQNK